MKKLVILLIILLVLFIAWISPASNSSDSFVSSVTTLELEDEDNYVFDPEIIQAILPISEESSASVEIPSVVSLPNVDPASQGFSVYATSPGITIYSQEATYLLVIDLNQAGIRALHNATGDVLGPGIWDGNDTAFKSKALGDYLSQGGNENFACAFNGQFFKMVKYPTGLAAPLKANGEIITYGWETKFHKGEKLMLEVWPDRTRITPLDKNRFENSDAVDIITGLTALANKKPKSVVGRTFVGTHGESTLMVLVSPSSNQRQMESTLKSLGAEVIMMLDGGGSTQLSCRISGSEQVLRYSERLIPQAVYVYSH